MRPKKVIAAAGLIGASVALLLFLHRFSFASQSLWWRTVTNAGHAPLFGLLALIMLWLMRLLLGERPGRSFQYPVAWIVAVGMGAFSEYLQIATQRDADPVDWLRDIAGATAFLALHFVSDSHLSGWMTQLRDRAATLIRVAAFVLLATVGIPVAICGVAYWQREAAFPELHAFDSYLEMLFLDTSEATLLFTEPPTEWIGPVSQVAQVTFNPSEYPTLYFEEPHPDWRGYEALTFDLFCPADSSLYLYITIHDRRFPSYHERYNGVLTLQPGRNSLSVSLAEIEHGPRRRLLDISTIQAVHLFLIEPPEPLVLYLDNVRLQ